MLQLHGLNIQYAVPLFRAPSTHTTKRSDVAGAIKHAEAALRGECMDVDAMAELAGALGKNGRPGGAIDRCC